MKKLFPVLLLILLLILVGCSSQPQDETLELSQEDALKIVYEDLGLNEKDLTIKKIEKEKEGTSYKYEIELFDNKYEYDYEVTSSGKIIKSEKEVLFNPNEPQKEVEGITENEALGIALKDAGLKEEEVQVIKIGKDIDYNTYEYEIEFINDNQEYDYEISSQGEILKKEVEKRK